MSSVDIFEYLVKESEAIKGQLRNHKSFDMERGRNNSKDIL